MPDLRLQLRPHVRRLIVGIGLTALAATSLAACFPAEPDVIEVGEEQPVDADQGDLDQQGNDRLPPVADPLAIEQLAAFSGVAMVNAGSNCSGTLVDTGVAAGPAYVLTNGHCVGDVGRAAQATTTDLEWFGTVEFLRAAGNRQSTVSVEVTQLAYSTMRFTDTAFIRLDATLDELAALGVRAVPLAEAEPEPGDEVVNIGVPVQDIPEEDWVLRRGECTLGTQATIVEHGWLWKNVWANDCPGIIQGSSGSPLLSLDDAGEPTAIVGLINTTSWGVTADDGGACFINRPCQVTPDGLQMVEETSYAQSVATLGACFDAAGEFALADACPLPRSSVWSETAGGAFQGGSTQNAIGETPAASFVARTAGAGVTTLVPFITGDECTDPATYAAGESVELPEAGDDWERVGVHVDAALPEIEGWYALCAVREGDYAGAATVLFEVDRTPPLFEANADVEDIGGGAVVIRPHLNPPEISTVRFTWGAPEATDCTATETFQDFFIVPLTVSADEMPIRYCVYGMDAAGNRTDVTTIEVPAP